MIYFDHNATTPLLPAARRAWLDATEKFIGNPSSPHRIGSRADALTFVPEDLARWTRRRCGQPGNGDSSTGPGRAGGTAAKDET